MGQCCRRMPAMAVIAVSAPANAVASDRVAFDRGMARIVIGDGIEGEISMKFLASVFSRQGFAVLFLSALLGACTVVVDDGPGPRPRPPRPEPEFCTRQYEPVCARRGGDRQTFANACLADRAGYRIVRDGPCRGDGGDGGGEEQTFCTREYAPVCARRHGEMRSFPNACEARAADYRIVGDGPC